MQLWCFVQSVQFPNVPHSKSSELTFEVLEHILVWLYNFTVRPCSSKTLSDLLTSRLTRKFGNSLFRQIVWLILSLFFGSDFVTWKMQPERTQEEHLSWDDRHEKVWKSAHFSATELHSDKRYNFVPTNCN